MRFTVIWMHRAEDDLASLWLAAQDRDEISAAADLLDSTLRDDANLLPGRTLYSPPLAIDFEVIVDDRLVRVLACWRPF